MSIRAIDFLPQDYCQFLVNFYREELEVEPEDHLYGCFIPKKKPSGDGYIKIDVHRADFVRAGADESTIDTLFATYGETNGRNILLHVVAFKAMHGCVPDGRSEQISHLCGERACFNHSHLVKEDTQTNNLRKNCPRALLLPLPHPDGRKIVVRTCDGHGSNHYCVMPTSYSDTSQYDLHLPLAAPRAGITGTGGGTRSRKTAFKIWKKKGEKRQREESDDDFV